MKLTEEKVNQLKELAFRGVSNPDIAKQLGVSVSNVYAKRSQLGITIDKVKAAKNHVPMQINPVFEKAVQNMDTKVADAHELDAKRELLLLLEPAIIKADKSVKKVSLIDEGKSVLIVRIDGVGTRVDIEGDSLLAIIFDVTRKCMF